MTTRVAPPDARTPAGADAPAERIPPISEAPRLGEPTPDLDARICATLGIRFTGQTFSLDMGQAWGLLMPIFQRHHHVVLETSLVTGAWEVWLIPRRHGRLGYAHAIIRATAPTASVAMCSALLHLAERLAARGKSRDLAE